MLFARFNKGGGEDVMSEERTMRELNNAIDSLRNKHPVHLFKTIKIKDASCPFHLEVFRDSELKGDEVLKYRVTLNRITTEDETLCRNYKMPGKVFTKKIACKTGRGKWIFKEIL